MTSTGAARYRWDLPPDQQEPSAKRPRTAKFLHEMLLPLPDPNIVPKPEDLTGIFKTEATVTCLEARHKEQRRRLLERHTAMSMNLFHFHDDLIDPQHLPFISSLPPSTPSAINSTSSTTPTATTTTTLPSTLPDHFPPESITLLSSSTASNSLRRLPADRRSSLVSMDQFTPSTGPSNRQGADENLKPMPLVSSAELAAKIATSSILQRQRLLTEEQELRHHQFDTKRLFYEALMRGAPDKYGKDTVRSSAAAPPPMSFALGGGQKGTGKPTFSSSTSGSTSGKGPTASTSTSSSSTASGLPRIPGMPKPVQKEQKKIELPVFQKQVPGLVWDKDKDSSKVEKARDPRLPPPPPPSLSDTGSGGLEDGEVDEQRSTDNRTAMVEKTQAGGGWRDFLRDDKAEGDRLYRR